MANKTKKYLYNDCSQCRHGREKENCPCDSCIVTGTDDTKTRSDPNSSTPSNYAHDGDLINPWGGSYWTAKKWG